MKRSQAETGQVLVRTSDVHVVIRPRVIGLEVAALVYGISADVIARLQDTEGFPMIRQGRRRLVPVAHADAWFEERVTSSSPAAGAVGS